MNKQSDKANSNNKAKSFSDPGKEKSPIKKKKNKSQRYLASRLSLYPQLMLILPSFSFSKTLTLEEFADEKNSNIESDTLEESNPHHNESLITFLDPIAENKMSNIQPIHDDTNERTPVITPSARSSSHLTSHAITPIGILPTPVQNHTINQAPAILVTPPTTLNTPPPQHSQQQAVISGKDSATTTEDVTTHVSGKLTIIDFDRGEAHFSNTDIIGTLGTLHLTDNGAWTYDLNNTNPTVQALGKGATATDSITVHSADGTPHQITITVNGTNDKAVIGGSNTGAVTEESQLHTSGTLTVTDVDTGEAHFSNTNIVGTLGTLHLTDNGNWTYDLDNTNPTVQALGKGATATDTITVHSADGTPHQVTITVNGTNDKAVIGGSNTGAVTEESQLHTSGTLTVTDVDTGEAHFSNTNIVGTLGTLHLTDNGNWTYDLDNTNPTVQALGKGATATDSITVHSADGTPHQVTITVNGTNDTAVIGGSNTGAVTEETQLHTSGTLTITDIDTGEAHFSSTDIIGSLGTLHLTDSGAWTYDLDNTNPTVQALGKGATATDTITVHSADGTPHQVTITVNGTNDTAVISGSNTGAVTEETQRHTSGTLTVTDVDTGEAHFSNSNIIGTLGTLHLTDNGAWTYDLDNTNPTVQALGKGSTATDTITVHSADGTPHQVTITVNGTNDKAVIGGSNTGAVTEESQLHTSGTLTVTDVDTGEAHFSNTNIVGTLGTLHLTDNGAWTYDLDNTNPTVQALGKGSTATDSITVHSADGTPHQVTITVNGTNDTAVIGGSNTGAVTEESQLHTSGTLTVTDVDTGEAHFSTSSTGSIDITGTLGTLHLTDNGAWTYDLNNTNPTVQALGKGATATDSITVHSADGTPHKITITVNGTNDKAVIGGSNTGAVTEESQLHTSGTLTVTDVDTGEAHFATSSTGSTDIAGTFGTLHLTDSGQWTYDLDNTNPTVQALGKGATATDTITVHSADGTPHQVTITVNGTNDKAVIGGSNTGAVTEETQLHTSGTLTVTDVDTGEAHFATSSTGSIDIIGTLGTLHLTDNGAWTYDLNNTNPTVQALGKGSTATDSITVHSADGTPHQVTITVNGTNDKAVIGGSNTGAVTEETQLHTSGTLSVTDVDTGEAHFSNTNIVGTLGTLHLTDNGNWTYDLDNTNPTVQALGKGSTATDTITVHSADGTPHQVTITVNGTNDKAVIGGSNTGAVTEETQLHTSGTLTVTDIDTGEAHFSTSSTGSIDITGTLGTLHLTDNGQWTYDLDNTNPTVQALGKGSTATDSITVHSADGTPHQVTITVNGTNDKAVIGGSNTGAVTEESQLHTSGTLTVTDVDTGEAHFSNTNIVGTLGTLHLTDNGAWTYDLDNTNLTVQALGKGSTATDSITVHSADGTPHQITITVNGTNDTAVISGSNTGAVTEETQLHTSGTLTVTDVDTGEAHFSNTNIVGTLGTLHLTDNGNWTYDLDNTNPTIQALGKGTTATDSITVHSADGTPHQVTITVNGTNDTAVIGGSNTGAVTEESQLQTSGTLTVTDVDTGEAHFSNTNIVGTLGTLHLTDNGNWTYDLDNTNPTVQALGKGSTATDSITVHSADGTPHQITITVNGTNDTAVISGSNTGAVTEETQLHTSGTLTVTDVDTGEAHFSNTNIVGTLGTLHLTDNGSWTYDLDNTNPAVQALGKGSTATDTITVHSADGTPHQVAITVNGTNDNAVIGGSNTGAVTEESQLQTSGTLTVTDVDTGEAHFSNSNIIGTLGTLHLTDNGSWTYDLDNSNPTVQALSKGSTATDTITVNSADGTPHQVTITVNGTNDKAVIGGSNTGAVTEESQLHASGTLTVTDVDTGEAHFSNTNIIGALGTLHLTDSGQWTYDLDNTNPTVQALGQGKTATDTITVHSADGTPHQVTITVNGTNDKAVIGGSNTGAVTEETQLHTSGTLTVTDVDTGEAHFSNTNIVGTLGTLHLTDNGAWTYDLDNTNPTVQALGKGSTATDSITVHSADGTPHQVTITVNGTNDTAVIGGSNTGAVTEESQLHTSGTLTVTDVDTGEAHFSTSSTGSIDITGTLGTLHLTDNGAWTYDLNNTNPTVQALGKGATATDSITVHSADGTPHQVTITVNGTNDTAIIGSSNTGAVTEESQLQTSGTLTVTDVDTGEAHFATSSTGSIDITGALGTLHLTDSGAWTYDLDNTNPTVQALGKGSTATDSITVHSADGTPHQVTITVNGTNDKAVIGGTNSGSVTEESQLHTSGTLSVTDVDTGEAHFSSTDIIGSLGTLHLTDSGAWTYDLDNTNPTVQALGKGATATDSITVHSADGTPHQVTITVNGTNDKAVIGGSNTGAVTEESQLQTSGTLTVTDVDTGEAHFSNSNIIGTLGTLHLTDNGSWTYDLDNTNPTVQALGKGSTATDSITVHSADGTPHQVTITVNGTNDKAVIGGSNTGAVTEESQLHTSGTLTVTDVDTGEAHFATSPTGSTDITGTLGTLHLTDKGAWTYDLDNTNPNVQALGKGATATDTITVHSADGTPHQVTITVNGTNDTAVIGGSNTGAVTEETQLHTSGTLTVTDIDTGEAHFSSTDIIGSLGTLHLTDSGAWTYDLDNTNPAVQALGKGATATDTITVHSADGTPHQVTITVNSTNDKAVIAGTDSGAVTEESQLHTSGTLTVTDVDTGEAHFSNTDIIGTLGTLHLTDNGAWTYDLDNTNPAVQALGKGTTATDSITVHSADGTPHQVTITVNGTNDTAVIGGSNTGAVTEESQLQTSGTLTVTDVDTGEAHFSNTDIAGTLGTLHLTDNGSWTYDLDNSNSTVQALGQGQQVKDIITVQSADGTPHQISIVVNGKNDATVITGTTTGAVTEDRINGMQWLLTGGKMHVSDSDSGEAKFDPVIHAHNYAGIGYTSALGAEVIVTPDGDWHYQLDNNITQVQSLGQGQSYIDKVTVHTVDGTMQELQVTITGTNDAPTVTGSRVLPAGTEDQTLHITQAQLLAGTNDIDKNDAGTLHVDAVTADHGTVTNNPDGSFTFHPDKDYNGQVHFTYNVKDAHGGSAQATASTTLAATSDSAIISEVSTDHVTEDGSHSRHNAGITTELANGRLQVVDPDSGENKFQYSQFGESAVHDPFGGMLRIDSMGNWGYSVNNANLQHLAQGQTETVVYRVHSYDGTAYELHIDVVGTNDAPTVTQVALSNGTEDTHYQMQASQFGFTDVDTGDTLHSIAITDLPPATQGKFVLDGHDITAGQHIPTADISKLQFVPAQDFNGDVQFKYTVNDGHTDSTEATNTLHFDAVGDVAVITGTTTGDVDEGHGSFGNMSPDYAQPGMAKLGQSALTADGKLDIVDPDTGESQFDSKGGAWNNSYHGQYGHLLLNNDGTWHYDVTVGNVDWVGNRKTTVGTTIDELGESQTLTDTITVYSKDGTSHDIVITIHGDNDRPYISSEVTLATGTEDTAQTLTTADLLTNTVDVDANDAGKLTIENLVSDHGSLLDNKDGTFTFTPEKDYNGVVHFSYDVKDAHGGVTHTGATTTLAAVGDAAIITSGAQQTIIEDASGRQHEIASGKLSIIDPDAGEQQFQYSQFGEQVLHDPFGGHLNISAAGSWGYSVPNSALQHLGAGQTEQVSYLVHSRDGTAHTITIDVVGTNDKPTVNAQVITSTEDQVHTFNASEFGFADVDDGAALDHITIATVPTALEGSLTLNGKLVHNGDIVAASEIGNLNFIPAKDFTGVINFGYSVNDGAANSSLAIMKLDISNVNDAAHFQGDKLGSVTEDLNVHSGNLLTQGTLQSTDVDNPDNRFSAENIHQLADGSAAQGQLMMGSDGRWVYRIDNTAVQHLGSGATLTETFTVHSIDGTEQAIAVTVVGTNDAPTLTVQLSGHSAGQLHGSDIDTGDQMQYDTLQPHGQFGQLHVDPTTGAFSYQQAASVAGMNFDPTTGTYSAKEVFEVRVSDGHGGESHQFVSFDVTATVSAPAITGGVPTITTQIANVPVVTTTQPQQIASIPPVNKVNLTLAASSDTGSSSTDHITHDNTPMISGTTDIPFSQVTIYEGSTPVAHAISDANGDYSTDLTTLTDGLYNLSAKALAPSSVLPVVSGVLSVNIDTDTVTPSVDLAATSDSGISNHDDLTNQHTPVITGLAEANATISITDEHGNIVASGTSDASGQYQLTTSNLAEGAQTLTVEATDTAGNQQSATLALQVDYTAPTISNVYLSTSTTHQTTFAGSVDIDTTQVDIVIKHGNQIIETLHATLDGKGGYSVDATNLPDQTYTAYIQATDKAGNQTPSKFDRFSVDTHADTPSISFESTGNDNQYNAAEVAVGAAGTITAVINIPADADKSDTLFINGQAHVLTGAEILAKQVLVEIAPGAKISASITDANGNASALAQANAPTADLSAAPLTITLVNDTGVANDLITNDGLLTITGQETGASIEYSIDNGKTWASSFTPQQGSNTVSVRQTDLAGNVSPESAFTFTLDNQVAPPVISLKNDTSAHVGTNSDHITQDAQLNITAEAGATLEYSIDGGQHWSTQFSPNEGQNNLQVRQTDTAGNISGASHFSFTLDTTPGTISVDPISKDNALNTAENNQPLVITGSTSNIANGDQVYVKFDGNHVYLASVKADGTWSLSLSASEHQSLMSADKDYSIKIGSVDVAGNVTPEISTHLLVDTHNPIPVISVNSVTTDNIINKLESSSNIDITGSVSGDFSAGDAISLTINGQLVTGYSGQVNAQGHYSISVPAHVLLSQNIHSNSLQGHTIEASVITLDSVGNVGSASSGVRPFNYDTHCEPPKLSLTHDTGNAQDHISSDGALTIQNQEVGAIIEYSVDGGNTWSHQFSPISGSNTVLARQTDTAGNISGNSSLTFTLDNSVNAPQVSLKTDSGDSATDQLSNHGELSVTGLEKGAIVEYSTDNGGHWQQSFTPVEGLNNVQVRQTDVAGNVSAATTVSYTLDTHMDIRVNSADIDNNGEMYVQVYLPRDSEVTQIEITSDGGGTPVLVNVNVPHKGGPSSSHPDHQYLQFDHIDLSTLAEGQLNIHVTGTDHAGNTATAQSLNSYGHPLILDRTASASDDSNTALEDSVQPVTGNVLSNDSDAIALTTIGDVQGTYGLFHLNTNGSYTYTLDNNLAAVQQLGAGSTPLVDSVVYSAVDNHGNTTTADLAIAIQGTNDAPKVGAAFINIQEDTPHALSVTDFHFSDVDGDALSSITITSLTHGHLELNGQTVNVGDKVSASDIAHLSYTPDANYHSSGARGLGGIEFTASDGHDSSNAGHIFFDITSVNDLPTVIEKQLGSHHVKEDSNVDTAGQLVITDIDGDTTSVALDPSHTASFGNVKYDTHSGLWLYSVDNNNKQVNGLNNGDTLTDKFSLLVDDGHGGQVSKEIVMTIDGHTDTPPIPTLATPATISGSAGHQDLHALLGIPPTLQQGTPNLQTGWGISDSHGHSVNTLHGQFGTLHINPATGELHYDYAPSSGVIKAHSGGNSGGTDETDTFMLTLGGSQNSHVEVHLHLHSQSVHGNSGHHIDQTTLTGMDISPILPTHPAPSPAVQHDEPDFSNNPISELSFSVDLDEHSSGASAYLDALGITPPPKLTEHNDHHAPTDLDIVLAHDNTAITDDHSSHIDLSDAMEHHNQDHSQNKQEDESHHHHNDIDGLPDIDPNT